MKTTIPEFKEKYPKLILRFERTTGHNAIYRNKITKNFRYWLKQKIKYKTLICNDPNCPKYGQEFPSKRSLVSHKFCHKEGYSENKLKKMKKVWNKPGYKEKMKKIQKEAQNRPEVKEKHSKLTIKQWQNSKFRERMTGKNCPMYNRYGRDHPTWRGDDVSVSQLHERVKRVKPIPEVCDICHQKYDKYGSIKLELSNIKNHQYTDNPDDYQYVHRSCHFKYDNEKKRIKS